MLGFSHLRQLPRNLLHNYCIYRAICTTSLQSGKWFSGSKQPVSKHIPHTPRQYNHDWEHGLWENIPNSKFISDVEKLIGLEDADEAVQKLFTYEYATMEEVVKARMDEMFSKFNLQTNDKSHLAFVLRYTIIIRKQKQLIKTHHKYMTVHLSIMALIHKRIKHLRFLRTSNYPAFERVCRELNIAYKHEDPFQMKPVTEEMLRKKAIKESFYKERMDRLNEYRVSLEADRSQLLEDKQRILPAMRDELTALGLSLEELFSEVVHERQDELMTVIHADRNHWFELEKELKVKYEKIRAEKAQRQAKTKRK